MGFGKSHPPPTAGVNGSVRVKLQWVASGLIGVWVLRKRRENSRKLEIQQKSHRNLWDFARSGGNLIGFDEISPDPVKISPDLREISPEFGFFSRNLGFFRLILEFFSPEYGFFSGRFSFFGFWGIETETDPPESVSRGRKPAADHRNSRVNRFRIDSDRVLWVGRVSDGFGQAYM